jgi:hypothetical protein
MGATTFETVGRGATPRAAFAAAKSHAQWERGHGGYTGTIAEKHDFTVIDVPAGQQPREFAAKLLDADDPRVCDKWGPAGCVRMDAESWLFFGLASC